MLITQNHITIKQSTKKFDGITSATLQKANKYAAEKKSYVFPMFETSKRKGFSSEPIPVGYAVPQ